MIAAIRIRGQSDINQQIDRTLKDLNIEKRNQCVVFENSDAIRGMLDKAKDYITFGEISAEVEERLAERLGKEELESGDVINLAPPSGGFNSIKKQVGQGGALGERENLDELVIKMS